MNSHKSNLHNQITVLGDGAWGTAIASLLAANGHAVTLWCHNVDVAYAINTTRYNERYLPNVQLSDRVSAVTSIEQAVRSAQVIFEAIPVKYLRPILIQAKPYTNVDQTWIILSKGIEQETLSLPSQIIAQTLENVSRLAVLSGPSFAHDVVRKQVTAVTVAASDCAIAHDIQSMLANNYFRPYTSRDLVGVQVGGAVKNVIALGVGLLDGAGFTDNAQAFLITRGLHEMIQLSAALGGEKETLYGLSGMGDLILTSLGKHSKNRAFGKRIGQGASLAECLQQIHSAPEGINTLQSLYKLIQQYALELPVCSAIYSAIFKEMSVSAMVDMIMAQPLEREC